MLKSDEQQNLENDIDKFSKEGIHAIGIAMMEINDVDNAYDIGRELNDTLQMKHSNDNLKSQVILSKFRGYLDLIGIIGMKNASNTRDSLLMEELRKNGVKVFFISSDNSHENITDLNSLRLFHNYKHPLNVVGRTDR
jgi:hypothetical protein